MEIKNPATPPSGATPGSNEKVITPPSTTTPPSSNGEQPEGKVTLTLKEFSALNRDAARFRSNVKRGEINNRKNNSIDNPTGDPAVDQVVREANERAEKAEKLALQTQVQTQVKNLLENDKYKNIPKSTKELILKNPHLLSQADNLEEALLDIEDFLIENVLPIETVTTTTPEVKGDDPKGHETPPTPGSGGPAPTSGTDFEDTSKLSGPAKSQAMIRNKMRRPNQK